MPKAPRTLDTTVAGASWLLNFFLLLLFRKSTWHALRAFSLGHLSDGLGGAVHDMRAIQEAFDEPMALIQAVFALCHTRRAQVIITILANVAVVMFVKHRLAALIAIH